MLRIVNIVGARPNFIKIGPLMAEYRRHAQIEPLLVHTGQHYDPAMSALFFEELQIPKPDVNLGVGSASHAVQTAEIMKAMEPVLLEFRPDVMVVVGDVNSTVACGLVAVKLGIKLAHVEAGLRSFDRRMPEEINRLVTDSISDLLFCTEQSGVDNLMREGVLQSKVHLVGNVMIDTLLANLEKARTSTVLEDLQVSGTLNGKDYALLTLHRPSNVDRREELGRILDAVQLIQQELPLLFPVHPRTRDKLQGAKLMVRLESMPNVHLMDPLGYLDFLNLLSTAQVVLTDSGGIQEETTIVGVPCLTLRENTERPSTVESGSNTLVGSDPDRIVAAFRRARNGSDHNYTVPPLWDGKAAERIVKELLSLL